MIDMVHDATNVMAKGDEDRISNLPHDIIHRILSFLDIKHAIQTSQLSRRWKHVWTSMQHLSFNSRWFRNVHRFAIFTDHVLSHRNDEIDVSEIELTFTGLTTKSFVKNVVDYACLHNVQKLTMICNGWKSHNVPHYLFSSHTLKHLTLQGQSCGYQEYRLPTFAWDFPALETLSLGNMCFCGYGNVIRFPKVFNVVAPKLKNLTASVRALRDPETSFDCLQLKEGSDSLDKVNLFLSPLGSNKIHRIGLPALLNLFQKLRSANFLILNSEIIETLGLNMNQLSHEPCPFNNLKCLKIEDRISKIATQVRKYLLENSPDATFIMDLPQVEAGNPDYEIIRSMSNEIESVMVLILKSLRLNMEAQFFSQYEALKSLFLTRIDASEWEKIVTELGSIRHFERTRSTDIHTQSNAPADMATSSRVA